MAAMPASEAGNTEEFDRPLGGFFILILVGAVIAPADN